MFVGRDIFRSGLLMSEYVRIPQVYNYGHSKQIHPTSTRCNLKLSEGTAKKVACMKLLLPNHDNFGMQENCLPKGVWVPDCRVCLSHKVLTRVVNCMTYWSHWLS